MWTDKDELNFQMGDMHGEVGEQPTLEEKIVGDIIWEATTPLTGWKKQKAFIERVIGRGGEQ